MVNGNHHGLTIVLPAVSVDLTSTTIVPGYSEIISRPSNPKTNHRIFQVGNCVTLSKLKAFVYLLCLLPVTFLIAVLPIGRILIVNALLALEASKQNEWVNQVWWDWWGSWIICAGPFGRWIVGTIFGYILLKENHRRESPTLHGHLVEEPHLRVFITAGIVLLLSVFSVVRIRKIN